MGAVVQRAKILMNAVKFPILEGLKGIAMFGAYCHGLICRVYFSLNCQLYFGPDVGLTVYNTTSFFSTKSIDFFLHQEIKDSCETVQRIHNFRYIIAAVGLTSISRTKYSAFCYTAWTSSGPVLCVTFFSFYYFARRPQRYLPGYGWGQDLCHYCCTSVFRTASRSLLPLQLTINTVCHLGKGFSAP